MSTSVPPSVVPPSVVPPSVVPPSVAPSSAVRPCVVLSGVSFTWPDGTAVFDRLDLAIGPGRTGLIGLNGSGKSTLLRLIAGGLAPSAGSVRVAGDLAYLPQDLTLDAAATVEEVLGIAGVRAALAAIERGDGGADGGEAVAAHLGVIGDDWDIEERGRATLDRLGLTGVAFDRPVGELSGGEAVLVGLAARFLRRPAVLLLDEPTNNLDRAARLALHDSVASFPGALVVVSHDRELLDLVDQVVEVRDGAATRYGGNLSAYEQAVEVAQDAARRAVRAAGSDVRRQRRDLAEARIKLDRRARYGQKMWDSKREPKIIMGARKRQAQVSAGKHRTLHTEKLAEARDRLAEAEEAVREDAEIRVDLPRTAVPAGRDVLTIAGAGSAGPGFAGAVLRGGVRAALTVRGPERLALIGDNGSGKTTLLRTIAGLLPARAGQVRPHVPLRYLPQRLDLLDDARTVLDNVAGHAPGATDNEIRARLARFQFRGARAERLVGSLSGGERFRATLAALLLAEPPPQLLLLDEPTNDLDLASTRQLVRALESYQGALIVASHDLPLLRDLRPDRWLRVGDGVLSEVDAP